MRKTNEKKQATTPTSTVNYLYDGSGQRVAMQATVNGTVTTTAYIGNIEEVQTSGSTTQTTTYYTLGGKRVAAKVNGTLYCFGYDALGSQVAVLNTSGSVVGSQRYSPYGSKRYSNGMLPTSIGFTGQRADLSFTNPAMAFIETIAKFALKNALAGIVWMIDDGLKDVLASFAYVNPVVKVWVDIASVVLDVISTAINIISTVSIIKSFSLIGNLASGMQMLSSKAQAFIEAGGSTRAIGPLMESKFTNLGALVGNDFLGLAQLNDDWDSLEMIGHRYIKTEYMKVYQTT